MAATISKDARIRLFVAGDLVPGGTVALAPEQAHYATRVMRLGAGDSVLVFNGRDGEWFAEIVDASKGRATLRLGLQTRAQAPEPGPWLAFAPLKKAETVFVVEKATELGVERVLPVTTRRTASQRVNVDRLRANAVEAAEQCERLTVPMVDAPRTLDALMGEWPKDRTLFVGDERGGGRPLVDALTEAKSAESGVPVHGFLIGPEGGFDSAELDDLGGLPFVARVGMGPRVMRAETAAVAALACWQAICGDGRIAPRSVVPSA